MTIKNYIAKLSWAILVYLGGEGTIAIYGFGGGNLPQRLAGRIMMSGWWPHGKKRSK